MNKRDERMVVYWKNLYMVYKIGDVPIPRWPGPREEIEARITRVRSGRNHHFSRTVCTLDIPGEKLAVMPSWFLNRAGIRLLKTKLVDLRGK